MPYGWHDGGWAFWMILSWALIVAIVVLVVRAFSSGGSSERSERTRDPRAILDERFARGEISEDEYRERTSALNETRR